MDTLRAAYGSAPAEQDMSPDFMDRLMSTIRLTDVEPAPSRRSQGRVITDIISVGISSLLLNCVLFKSLDKTGYLDQWSYNEPALAGFRMTEMVDAIENEE